MEDDFKKDRILVKKGKLARPSNTIGSIYDN